jgi:hypothetical protein
MSAARPGSINASKRDLGAVDVPAGEVGVLGAAARLVHGAVHADAVAADIAERARGEQGVVERGVERARLAGAAAADPDPAERLIPAPARRGADRGEAATLTFGPERGPCPGDADEGDPDPHGNRALAAGVEGRVGPRPRRHLRVAGRGLGVRCRFGARFELPFGPGPRGGERLAEAGREVDLVAGALAAEEAARGAAGDFALRRVDLHRRFVIGLGAAAGIDQDARGGAAGEGEAAEAGPRRRRQRHPDRPAVLLVELDRVVAGRAALARV